MKYIVLAVPIGGMQRMMPIIFPNLLAHASVAETMLASPEFKGATVRSAGHFSSMDLEDVQIADEGSTSLGVGPHPDDSLLIRLHDYRHGIE
jgi:hypothetical protein